MSSVFGWKTDSQLQVSHEVSFSDEDTAGMLLLITALTVCYGQVVDFSDYFIPDHITLYRLKPSEGKIVP